jgi:hypothetical protein
VLHSKGPDGIRRLPSSAGFVNVTSDAPLPRAASSQVPMYPDLGDHCVLVRPAFRSPGIRQTLGMEH